jgi:hypothetical protein
LEVQRFQFGLDSITTDESEDENGGNEGEGPTENWSTQVERLCDEVGKGDQAADDLQSEVLFQDDLGCSTGVGFGEQLDHGFREEGWTDEEGEEDRATEPEG